ncbi:MAG: hypothetical protein J1D77_07100 [Muribaculaceae bacterium]|nr:hypothetical protein [Muribaculaceae bacterium]
MELYKALREIIEKRGTSVIEDKILVNILDDYKGYEEAKGLKNILRDFIDKNYSQKLLAIGGINSQTSALLTHFVHHNGYSRQLANYLLASLVYGLGWTNDEPVMQSEMNMPQDVLLETKHLEFRGLPLGISENEFKKGIEKVGFKKEGDKYFGYFHGEAKVELEYFASSYTGNVVSLNLNIPVNIEYWDWHKNKYDKLVEDFSKKYKLIHDWSFYLADYSETDSDQRKYEGLKDHKVQVSAKFENDYGSVFIDMRAGTIVIIYTDNDAFEKHKEGVSLDV